MGLRLTISLVASGDRFEEVEKLDGWVSPRLGIRFAMSEANLAIYRPDGTPFLTHAQLFEAQQRDQQRADVEQQRAERMAGKLRGLGQSFD